MKGPALPELVRLNLNAFHLQRGRKAALDALISSSSLRYSRAHLEREVAKLDEADSPPEFVEAVRYHLARWLRKTSRAR